MKRTRWKCIACEILYREFCRLAADASQQIDLEFLPKGLHDLGSNRMRERLQEAIDKVDTESYQAILLGYALCGNGLSGLRAPAGAPLVIPRAHDCITLFLGSRERYRQYFEANPGAYFHTTGWIERGNTGGALQQLALSGQSSVGWAIEDLIARYGEENGRFLYSQLGDLTKNYRQITFIRTGIGPEDDLEIQSRGEAQSRGWEYESIPGDLQLLQQLLSGPWDDLNFAVVPPGHRLVGTHDETIFYIEKGGD
jgi:hypothetical protein